MWLKIVGKKKLKFVKIKQGIRRKSKRVSSFTRPIVKMYKRENLYLPSVSVAFLIDFFAAVS